MIPSHTWFPTNLAARAAWYANFEAQFVGTYAAVLGLVIYTGAVTKDNNDFQSIAATRLTAKNFEKAVADFLRDLTEGAIGSPLPVFPSESFAAPPEGVSAGIFQRLDELRTLIMAQPNYTEVMGSAMGIEASSANHPPPGSVEPTIQVFAAVHNYNFSIVVSNRGEATMWDVYILRKGGSWTKHGTYSGKSADITVTPTTPDEAEQIQVYVQLRKSNADYGQPSQPAYVTVNP